MRSKSLAVTLHALLMSFLSYTQVCQEKHQHKISLCLQGKNFAVVSNIGSRKDGKGILIPLFFYYTNTYWVPIMCQVLL